MIDKSIYLDTKIVGSRYSEIVITPHKTDVICNSFSGQNIKKGYVYLPYIICNSPSIIVEKK